MSYISHDSQDMCFMDPGDKNSGTNSMAKSWATKWKLMKKKSFIQMQIALPPCKLFGLLSAAPLPQTPPLASWSWLGTSWLFVSSSSVHSSSSPNTFTRCQWRERAWWEWWRGSGKWLIILRMQWIRMVWLDWLIQFNTVCVWTIHLTKYQPLCVKQYIIILLWSVCMTNYPFRYFCSKLRLSSIHLILF